MKTILILLVLLKGFACAAHARSNSFEEFRSLPLERREALLHDALIYDGSDTIVGKYVIWRWRSQMGEHLWQLKQQTRLAHAKGYPFWVGLFSQYQHVKEGYPSEEWQRRKASIEARNIAAASERWRKEHQAAADQYEEAVRLISALIITETANALNKQAESLVVGWASQFPQGTKWVITEAQMALIEQNVETIREQLKSLPAMSAQEVQAEIDKLPMTVCDESRYYQRREGKRISEC